MTKYKSVNIYLHFYITLYPEYRDDKSLFLLITSFDAKNNVVINMTFNYMCLNILTIT